MAVPKAARLGEAQSEVQGARGEGAAVERAVAETVVAATGWAG